MYAITAPSILEKAPEDMWVLIGSYLGANCQHICYRGHYTMESYPAPKYFYNFLGVVIPPVKIIYNGSSEFTFCVYWKRIDCRFKQSGEYLWTYIISQISYREPIVLTTPVIANTTVVYQVFVDFIQVYLYEARRRGEDINNLITLANGQLEFRGVPVKLSWLALWIHAVVYDDTTGVNIIARRVIAAKKYYVYASYHLLLYAYKSAKSYILYREEQDLEMSTRHHKRAQLYKGLPMYPE